MYTQTKISLEGISLQKFLENALAWADTFDYFYYFSNNNIPYPHDGFANKLFVGSIMEKDANKHSLAHISLPSADAPPWKCGFFTYDLKNQFEALHSSKDATIPFPLLEFIVPKYVLEFLNDEVNITCANDLPQEIFDFINNFSSAATKPVEQSTIEIIAKVNKEEYLHQIQKIKSHLWGGDIYEMNYCMEFYAEQVKLDYIKTFHQLNLTSPMPFAVLGKTPHGVVLCASPERFLKKRDNVLIAQPIKGTMRRSADAEEDRLLKSQLRNSPKEQAENMMIVDLVRSDLAKVSKIGSVKVEELFEVYSFQHVHQMISTVVSNVKPEATLENILKATFPMGSMTGAPKISAMQRIDDLEISNRGLYSGAIGMIDENGDFDFNVVIRSIIYNPITSKLCFHVGSAITIDSIGEQEYDECLLKAQAIFEVLKGKYI